MANHDRQTVLDDLRDLIDDIAADPSSHLIVGLLGFMVGCFGTIGLAWIYAQVAFG